MVTLSSKSDHDYRLSTTLLFPFSSEYLRVRTNSITLAFTGGNYVVATVSTFIKRIKKEATVPTELLYSIEASTEVWL